jgi:hypothetical protein
MVKIAILTGMFSRAACKKRNPFAFDKGAGILKW